MCPSSCGFIFLVSKLSSSALEEVGRSTCSGQTPCFCLAILALRYYYGSLTIFLNIGMLSKHSYEHQQAKVPCRPDVSQYVVSKCPFSSPLMAAAWQKQEAALGLLKLQSESKQKCDRQENLACSICLVTPSFQMHSKCLSSLQDLSQRSSLSNLHLCLDFFYFIFAQQAQRQQFEPINNGEIKRGKKKKKAFRMP